MNKTLYKISSILVAFLVLFSTLSFTVDKHYCGDRLVNTSIFSEAKGCSMEEVFEVDIEKNNEVSFSKKSCCKNVTSMIEGNSIDQQALQKLELRQVDFVTAFIISYSNIFENHSTQLSSIHHYKPPLIKKEVTILFENFRI